jgi:hypothetical protein
MGLPGAKAGEAGTMSDPESFAARWSRLKRATAKEQEEAASVQPDAEAAQAALAVDATADAQGGTGRSNVDTEAPFDPESLPPIDSITAGSDIKAFLQAGVLKHLTQAALRRAWTADPAIRDFIGLAENQWDFTDPTAMPGFGPLEVTDDLRQLVAQAMGRLADSTKVGEPEEVAFSNSPQPRDEVPHEQTAALQKDDVSSEDPQCGVEPADPQHVEPERKTGEERSRRTHGGALPR